MKNRVFLSENFQFLEVKFSIYLNRRVFVMQCTFSKATLHNEDSSCLLSHYEITPMQNI